METTNANSQARAWACLRSFYRFKSQLLPEFVERNKRALNLLESKLMEQYERGGKNALSDFIDSVDLEQESKTSL